MYHSVSPFIDVLFCHRKFWKFLMTFNYFCDLKHFLNMMYIKLNQGFEWNISDQTPIWKELVCAMITKLTIISVGVSNFVIIWTIAHCAVD